MLFSLIAEAISSVCSSLNGTNCDNTSDFGPDLFDIGTSDTNFNEFDLGWSISDFELF